MLREYLSNIADKFRTHLDTTEPINAQDFAGKVEDVAVRYNQLGFTNGYNLGLEEGKPLGKLELLQDSEYMNAKVSGTAIAVNDVNSIEHSVGVQLRSKNLLNAFDIKNSGGYNAFDTFEQSEGCVTVTSDNSTVRIVSFNLLNKYLQKGNYILSFDIECENSVTTSGNCDCIYIWHNDVFKTARSLKNDGQNGSIVYKFTLTEATHVEISWYKSVMDYVTNNTIYKAILSNIQLEIGTTATAYTPYVEELGGIEVSRYGKNLFDKDFASVSSNWIFYTGGYSYIKVFVGKGNTVTVSYQQDLVTDMDCPYAMIKLSPNGTDEYWLYYRTVGALIIKKHTFTSTEDYIYVLANVYDDESFAKFMQYIGNDLQIELGTTTTPYEPYIEPTVHTANADGTVDGIKSISPNMTLLSNNNGVVINANYLRDIDTYIDNLITNVALTGGE